MPAGTSQGKHLSSESPLGETLPVLSGSFIAGCRTAGFFLALGIAQTAGDRADTARQISRSGAIDVCG